MHHYMHPRSKKRESLLEIIFMKLKLTIINNYHFPRVDFLTTSLNIKAFQGVLISLDSKTCEMVKAEMLSVLLTIAIGAGSSSGHNSVDHSVMMGRIVGA